jgi:hypothetical protein
MLKIYKIIIFQVNSSETRTLDLREEHKLQIFGEKVLRKTSGHTNDDVNDRLRTLHKNDLHDPYR